MKPFASIIIPAYNRKQMLLRRALPSAFQQTERDFEVVVIDDGSIDGTEAALSELVSANKIRYIRQEQKGVSAARNRGTLEARGDIIIFLDSDDELNAGYVRAAKNAFRDAGVEVLMPAFVLADERGRKSIAQSSGKPIWLLGMGGGIAFRRTVFSEKKIQYDELLRNFEDTDFGLRVAAQCAIQYTSDPLYVYHFKSAVYTDSGSHLSSNPEMLFSDFEKFKGKNLAFYIKLGKDALSYLYFWEGTLYAPYDVPRAHECFRVSQGYDRNLRNTVYWFMTLIPSRGVYKVLHRIVIALRRLYKIIRYSSHDS